MSTCPDPSDAISIVVAEIVATLVEDACWEDYPEIGEYDWYRIVEHIELNYRHPDATEYEQAYGVLTKRAGTDAEGHLASIGNCRCEEGAEYA